MTEVKGGRVDIAAPDGTVFFRHEELMCPESGRVVLDPGFAHELLALRMTFRRPMIVTSCCRSTFYNDKIGGHRHSLHVWDDPYHDVEGTAAIDVKVGDAAATAELVKIALMYGWSVGVAATFVHLDRRILAGMPQGVFGYGKGGA